MGDRGRQEVREIEREGKSPGPRFASSTDRRQAGAVEDPRPVRRHHEAVTGAAPINPEILDFFDAAGVLVLEGWGMTETSTAATIATPEDFKFGTVGRPFPGCEIKIADDGEILVRARTSSRATTRTRRRRARRSSTAGCTPATSARSTPTATSRSPAARRTSSSPRAARTSPRRTSRPRSSSTRWSRSAS